MSIRLLTTSMQRHYLILLYKKYVEGVPMDNLYEAIPKCWVYHIDFELGPSQNFVFCCMDVLMRSCG